jgi:hypothetical protein
MSQYFHDFFKILTKLVDKTSQCGGSSHQKGHITDPHVTGKIFECMSHLLRSLCIKNFTVITHNDVTDSKPMCWCSSQTV